jgi:SAM-dependent methyltransferase
MIPKDLAGATYWDGIYQATRDVLPPVDPQSKAWGNYGNRQAGAFIEKALPSVHPGYSRLIELGCGNSQWLPYFASRGFDVWGIDYTESGCACAREILRQAQLRTDQIVCADLFAPPPSMLSVFDVAISIGLAEHFEDTTGWVQASVSFLKPGGIIITMVPNLCGLIGFLQKRLERSIYDKHVPLDLGKLILAHQCAGLELMQASYLCTFNFDTLNLGEPTHLKNFVRKWGHRCSMVLGAAHEAGLMLKPNWWLSSFIGCSFRKPLEKPRMELNKP